jgi:LPXTG-motif cell wall-anchored protein
MVMAFAVGMLSAPMASARAAESPGPVDVVIDVGDGAGLVDGPVASLFDPAALLLEPGAATIATVRVGNRGASSGRLSVQARGVTDEENGCNEPERGIDTTCESDQGEMGDALAVRVFLDATGAGNFLAAPAWEGPFRTLASGVAFDRPLVPGDVWGLRLELALPQAAGNDLQSDRALFALAFSLSQVEPPVEVEAVRLSEPVGQEALRGTPPVSGASDTVTAGHLPRTGASVGLLVGSGAGLLASGVFLLTLRRRRSGS